MEDYKFIDEKFMEMCSERTLQTNREGFFLDFLRLIEKNIDEEWITNVFGKLGSDSERFEIVYKDEKISRFLIQFLSNVQEVFRPKCTRTSEKRRQDAEKEENPTQALGLFSQSILKAPNGQYFSKALLGRSNILLSLEHYAEALTDLKLCQLQNLTDQTKGEIFSKLTFCYKALGEENRAKISMNLAEKLLGMEKIKNLNSSLSKMSSGGANILKVEKIVPVIEKKHPDFQHACKNISVKYTKDSGRFVVANEAIKTGETLVVEPPLVACLLPEKFGTHCHHCFKRFVAPYGCPDCSAVAFCTLDCQNSALKTYHKYECKYLDLLIGSGMSILSHSALRLITQSNLKNWIQISDKENFFNLCTNAEKRSPKDFLQRTLMAAFLLRCLQKSGYFNYTKSAVLPNEDEMKIGEILLRALQVLQFNAHEIFETLKATNENGTKKTQMVNIGVGLYATVALFNHDCYPAVTRYYVGKDIVVKTLRPLSRNDVIAENYGHVFTRHSKKERQRSLSSRYWFICKCISCTEDWPSYKMNINKSFQRIRCPTENCSKLFPISSKHQVICEKCDKEVSLKENAEKLQWCAEQYKKGSELVNEENLQKAIDVYSSALDVFHEVSLPPHKETHLAEDKLRQCFSDSGNVHVLN